MARSIWTAQFILDRIQTIKESEENKYTDIPGWDKCEFFSDTPDAILLILEVKGGKRQDFWFPYSQLRIAEDRQSIYCSEWILTQKGLG